MSWAARPQQVAVLHTAGSCDEERLCGEACLNTDLSPVGTGHRNMSPPLLRSPRFFTGLSETLPGDDLWLPHNRGWCSCGWMRGRGWVDWREADARGLEGRGVDPREGTVYLAGLS